MAKNLARLTAAVRIRRASGVQWFNAALQPLSADLFSRLSDRIPPASRLTPPPILKDSILGGVIGLGVAAVGLPVAAGLMGFTGAGIAVGSIGAKMMSAAAIANGGGVAAGGVVATLQSIGAAGVPTAVSAVTTATGAVMGALSNICG